MKNQKFCWLAKEYKQGWKLGFCLGNQDTRYIQGMFFASEQGVKGALKGNIVFVHMKNGRKVVGV